MDFSQKMKSLGIKCTRHRLDMMAILHGSDQPLSAERLYLGLREQGVSINLSSVYRNLETLEHHGLIRRTSIAGVGSALWEMPPQGHTHHLVCSACGHIEQVSGCPLATYERELQQRIGFDITDHKLELYGLCRSCRLVDPTAGRDEPADQRR